MDVEPRNDQTSGLPADALTCTGFGADARPRNDHREAVGFRRSAVARRWSGWLVLAAPCCRKAADAPAGFVSVSYEIAP